MFVILSVLFTVVISQNSTNRTKSRDVEYGRYEYAWNLDLLNEKHMTFDLNEYHVEKGLKGDEVDVYVFDTGIDHHHEDLKGKVKGHYNFVPRESKRDYIGHGTHVAGTIAGKYYGIAKNVNLYSVKVCSKYDGCNIKEALLWFYNKIAPNGRKNIISMSLGGNKLRRERHASFGGYIINKMYREYNVITVLAAGNEGKYGCYTTPGGTKEAITVGSMNEKNEISKFSNWGDCVDVYAPGEKIISAKANTGNKYMKLQGTSMATPHVTGALAVLWSNNPQMDAYELKRMFFKNNVVEDYSFNTIVNSLINKINIAGRLFLQQIF
jgi:serine protease